MEEGDQLVDEKGGPDEVVEIKCNNIHSFHPISIEENLLDNMKVAER